MGVLLPSELYYKQVDGGGAIESLGSFQAGQSFDLAQVILGFIKRGEAVGAERFRLKVYPTATSTVPLYTSDWRDLSDLAEIEPEHWVGDLRFDFAAAAPINGTLTYHLAIEGDGYAPDGDFHVGAVLDWPLATYSDDASSRRPVRFVLTGYRPVYPDPDRSDLMGQIRRVQIALGVEVDPPTDLQVGVNIDVAIDGTSASHPVDVSASVADARKVAWTLRKPSGSNWEQVTGVVITSTSASNVTLTTEAFAPLAAGTYRLVGVY